jgi:hypothetical protein
MKNKHLQTSVGLMRICKCMHATPSHSVPCRSDPVPELFWFNAFRARAPFVQYAFFLTEIAERRGLGGGLALTLGIVRLHDLVEVGLVDDSARLRALGFLLEVFAQEVEVELAIFDLRAGLESVPVEN